MNSFDWSDPRSPQHDPAHLWGYYEPNLNTGSDPRSPQHDPAPQLATGRLRALMAAAALLGLAGLCAWAAATGRAGEETPEAVGRDPADGPPALTEAPFDRFTGVPLHQQGLGTDEVAALGWEGEAPAAVAISPDGEWLAAAAGPNVSVYQAGMPQAAARLDGHPGPVTALAFAPDSKHLAVGGKYDDKFGPGGWVQTWKWSEGAIVADSSAEMTTGVRALACIPGTDLLAVGGVPVVVTKGESEEEHPCLELRRLANGLPRHRVLDHLGETVVGLAVSADGRRLAAVDQKGKVQLWALARHPAPAGLPWAAAGLLAAAGVGVLVWPWLTHKVASPLPRRVAAGLVGIALVACLGLAVAPHLGSSIQELEGVTLGAAQNRPLALSPDGTMLAVGNGKAVQLYAVGDGVPEKRGRLTEHTADVVAVAFGGAGPWVTSLDSGGVLRVTYVPTGQCVRRAEAAGGGRLAVSPDGRHAIAGWQGKPAVYRWWAFDELDAVLRECGEALALRPDDLGARERRARAYLRRGRLDLAVADLGVVVSRKEGQSPEAYWLRALAHLRREDRAAALADLEAVINLNPKDALAHYQRGLLQMQNKDYRAARSSLDRAFDIDPKLRAAHEKEDQP
jgi:WD40 repeat protein